MFAQAHQLVGSSNPTNQKRQAPERRLAPPRHVRHGAIHRITYARIAAELRGTFLAAADIWPIALPRREEFKKTVAR
jgi:hypothetical protein